jgi:molybdopterin-guanine dinucleotide biosynthesis protein A
MVEEVIPNMTGVLVAGGQSRRMGRDKRFLELGGQTLLQRALSVLQSLFPEVVVALAEPLPQLKADGYRVVTDLIPGCATLGGLYTGLASASHPRIFAVGCDMPFLNPAVIRSLARIGAQADVVMPELATGLQPMHAVYSKACLPHLERLAKARELKVQGLAEVPGLNVRLVSEKDFLDVDPQLLSFFNINTPADLEFARKLLAGSGSKRA